MASVCIPPQFVPEPPAEEEILRFPKEEDGPYFLLLIEKQNNVIAFVILTMEDIQNVWKTKSTISRITCDIKIYNYGQDRCYFMNYKNAKGQNVVVEFKKIHNSEETSGFILKLISGAKYHTILNEKTLLKTIKKNVTISG